MIDQLGYLCFGVSDLGAWETFMTHVLGLELVASSNANHRAMAFRMDGHAQRFFVQQDNADDLLAMGWQVRDAAALQQCVTSLKAAGVAVKENSPALVQLAKDRHVTQLVTFTDPGGIAVELFYGPDMASESFKSKRIGSHFVADELGLGHLVIATRDRDESRDFYLNVLGFKLSDYITCDIGSYHVDIAFMHTNPRHHSLAVGGPMPKKIHHFLLQVGNMDDVGLTYDRARDHGVIIEQELGRHPNDRMFSFYARTPSGFQFEFGWGGREVDDATWEPTTYHAISEWGHRRPPRKPSKASSKPT